MSGPHSALGLLRVLRGSISQVQGRQLDGSRSAGFNRERSGSNQAGERNAGTRTPPRGTRAGAGDPRNGGTPPRVGASDPRRPDGRPPSDPRPGRPGNGNGNSNGAGGGSSRGGGNGNGGSYRRPVAGGPDDGGDSRRSGAYSATGARGPRSVPGSGNSGRVRASMPGRDGGGGGNGATPPRRRSMADLARDASRSMSRQLSSVVSRTGHAIRHDAPPPQPRGPRTPPPGYTGAMLSAETAKLSPQAYRRSRSRMVARKWRRERIQRNPLLYFATVLFAFTALLSVVAGGGAGGAYAFSYYQSHYNDVLAVTDLQNQQNSIIYDRNGQQIAVLKDDSGNLNFYVPLKQVSPKVQWATIDTEDRNFYSPFNVGVDFVGTVRAALSNASGGSTQGGSTITQQLVKNIVIKDSKQTIDRKLHEAILAIGVNNSYTKAQILGVLSELHLLPSVPLSRHRGRRALLLPSGAQAAVRRLPAARQPAARLGPGRAARRRSQQCRALRAGRVLV